MDVEYYLRQTAKADERGRPAGKKKRTWQVTRVHNEVDFDEYDFNLILWTIYIHTNKALKHYITISYSVPNTECES